MKYILNSARYIFHTKDLARVFSESGEWASLSSGPIVPLSCLSGPKRTKTNISKSEKQEPDASRTCQSEESPSRKCSMIIVQLI